MTRRWLVNLVFGLIAVCAGLLLLFIALNQELPPTVAVGAVVLAFGGGLSVLLGLLRPLTKQERSAIKPGDQNTWQPRAMGMALFAVIYLILDSGARSFTKFVGIPEVVGEVAAFMTAFGLFMLVMRTRLRRFFFHTGEPSAQDSPPKAS